ncbi:TraR/DksA family transcriptional regulator [Xenorhabdus sp. XENO-1]|uniref:TraR/DksA family transcriptional regulator n=1 Tax=Xenorhabdus bovienii TaxID=40576 RepID=UPI0020CA3FA3|nr:TraR/DksA family transcriptional regulator [Xenorhabdus bovienii]MCP9267823.1 TraR/DksA family transcriptional regulator [Xenorhabdus bovienii subsp. africana]
MFDVIDRACQYAEETLARQIAEHVNRPVGTSAFECEDCGEAIPEIRRIRVMGCTRCVGCQADFELINKHYRS